MSYVNLTDTSKLYDDGMDSIVIQKYDAGIPGGVVLDVSLEPSEEKVIEAGRIIFTNGNGSYAPSTITDNAQATPAGYTSPIGILSHSILKSSPIAPVMTRGQVNGSALIYQISSTVLTALKNNYCNITFSIQ